MAPKRGTDGRFKSGGSVTGGSGDVKPQYLTGVTPVPAGTQDYGVVEILVPRLVLGGTNTATVMEILQVDYYLACADIDELGFTHWAFLNSRVLHQTNDASTLATYCADLADPGSFAPVSVSHIFLTSGGAPNLQPQSIDTTDKNGNGILIATDRIFFHAGNIGGGIASESVVKILYRMVNVGIREYVGIVASQMN